MLKFSSHPHHCQSSYGQGQDDAGIILVLVCHPEMSLYSYLLLKIRFLSAFPFDPLNLSFCQS